MHLSLMIGIFALMLIVISFVQPLADRAKVSASVLLAVIGIVVGFASQVLISVHVSPVVDEFAALLVAPPVDSHLILSIFLPAIWVALMAFHQDQIPFRMMATVSVSRLGLPLSAQMEMFILLMLLEVFREAGVRLPTAIGQTLTSIGGLIIGDAAIRAGLVSPSVVVIGAITAVCGVTLVNQTLSTVVSILRLFFFTLASFLGIYGVILGMVLWTGYLSSLNSFGVNYLTPLSPLRIKDILQSYLRLPWVWSKQRPGSLKPIDGDHQGEGEG